MGLIKSGLKLMDSRCWMPAWHLEISCLRDVEALSSSGATARCASLIWSSPSSTEATIALTCSSTTCIIQQRPITSCQYVQGTCTDVHSVEQRSTAQTGCQCSAHTLLLAQKLQLTLVALLGQDRRGRVMDQGFPMHLLAAVCKQHLQAAASLTWQSCNTTQMLSFLPQTHTCCVLFCFLAAPLLESPSKLAEERLVPPTLSAPVGCFCAEDMGLLTTLVSSGLLPTCCRVGVSCIGPICMHCKFLTRPTALVEDRYKLWPKITTRTMTPVWQQESSPRTAQAQGIPTCSHARFSCTSCIDKIMCERPEESMLQQLDM